MFGACDWNSLVTRSDSYYESGAFDIRSDPPRATALAGLVGDLAAGNEPDLPVLDSPGWWQRPERFLFAEPLVSPLVHETRTPEARPILITGAHGTLGRAFVNVCRARGLAFVALPRGDLDIADDQAVTSALERHHPWSVINAAGYVRVDDAETDVVGCRRANTTGSATLAAACARHDIPLVTFSTDLVFDGLSGRPYLEDDPVGPLNVYGASKVDAERQVLRMHTRALIIRASAFFGPWDTANFASHVIRKLRGDEIVRAADDVIVSPTYVPDLCHTALDLLIDGEAGVWHLATPEPFSWADASRLVAASAGLDPSRIIGQAAASFNWAARRPAFSALGSRRGRLLPYLHDSLERFVAETRVIAA